MANAIDVRSIIFAKHAQHVVLVHFPIALFLTSVGLDLLALFRKQAAFATAAYINTIAAAISVVPVLATGIAAWQWQLEGQRLKGFLLLHLVLGCASSLLICLVAWIRFRSRHQSLPRTAWGLQLTAAAMIAVTGHVGGLLSGVTQLD
jgi:uncharacterized membrane protein